MVSGLGVPFFKDLANIETALLPTLLTMLIIIGILIKSPNLIGVISIIQTVMAVTTMFTYGMSFFSSIRAYPGELVIYFILSIVRLAIGVFVRLFLAIGCFLRNRKIGESLCLMSALAIFVRTVFSIVFFRPVTVAMIFINICDIVGTVLIGKYVIGQQN